MIEVTLTYFKPCGTFYCSATVKVRFQALYLIWEEIVNLQADGKWPGLTEGPHDYITLVEVGEHPHNHPHLIIPGAR